MHTKVERKQIMPFAKISSQRQVTIPKTVFDELQLSPGDLIEWQAENGKATVIPQHVMATANVPKLSKAEATALKTAQKKIKAINTNLLKSKGLIKAEIAVAVKIGIIDKDQTWFWTEEWQKNMREAERDVKNGKTLGPFDNIKDALAALK